MQSLDIEMQRVYNDSNAQFLIERDIKTCESFILRRRDNVNGKQLCKKEKVVIRRAFV